MACQFSNGICGGCDNFVKTTSIAVSDTTLVLTIPTQTLTNGELLCVCLAQTVPTITGAPNVVIKVGTTTYTIIDTVTCGLIGTPNNLYATQLVKKCDGTIKSRQILNVRFATDTKCFNYVGCRKPLPKSGATFTPITIVEEVVEEIKKSTK